MPLGQGIGAMWEAVRDRIEVSGHGQTWHVTAGSFDSAFDYATDRFGDPVVLAREDRTRWWPRVTLTVTTDDELAAAAPPFEEIAKPPPAQVVSDRGDRPPAAASQPEHDSPLPSSLEAIFAHQEERRIGRQRTADHDRSSGAPTHRR